MDTAIRNNNSKENLPDGRIHSNSKLFHSPLSKATRRWPVSPYTRMGISNLKGHLTPIVHGPWPGFLVILSSSPWDQERFPATVLAGKKSLNWPCFLIQGAILPHKNIIWKWSFLRINHMLLYIKGVFWVSFTSIPAVFRTQIIPQPFKARIPAPCTGDPGENPLVPWLNKSDDCPIHLSPEEAVTDETRYIGRCPDTHRQ